MPTDGLILFAHGARDPLWATPFERVVQHIRRQRPALRVELAFLELMPPDLAKAGAALYEAGCRRIEVLPMFLGTGGHLKRDLPVLVQRLRETHPSAHWRLHPAVGEHPLVGEAMAAAALALIAGEGAARGDAG